MHWGAVQCVRGGEMGLARGCGSRRRIFGNKGLGASVGPRHSRPVVLYNLDVPMAPVLVIVTPARLERFPLQHLHLVPPASPCPLPGPCGLSPLHLAAAQRGPTAAAAALLELLPGACQLWFSLQTPAGGATPAALAAQAGNAHLNEMAAAQMQLLQQPAAVPVQVALQAVGQRGPAAAAPAGAADGGLSAVDEGLDRDVDEVGYYSHDDEDEEGPGEGLGEGATAAEAEQEAVGGMERDTGRVELGSEVSEGQGREAGREQGLAEAQRAEGGEATAEGQGSGTSDGEGAEGVAQQLSAMTLGQEGVQQEATGEQQQQQQQQQQETAADAEVQGRAAAEDLPVPGPVGSPESGGGSGSTVDVPAVQAAQAEAAPGNNNSAYGGALDTTSSGGGSAGGSGEASGGRLASWFRGLKGKGGKK